MILAWVALVVMAALFGLAVWNPYLFRMGWSHARARPMQTLAIIVGLGVAMGVLTGAAVAGDSAALALDRYEASLDSEVDIVADWFVGRGDAGAFQAALEGIDGVDQVAVLQRNFLSVDAVQGSNGRMAVSIGDDRMRTVAAWQALEGDLDGWGMGAVLTESAARDLHSGAGDTLVLHDRLSAVLQGPDVWTREDDLAGHWQTALRLPDGSYYHDDADVYTFDVEVPGRVYWLGFEATREGDANSDVLYVAAPDGSVAEGDFIAGVARVHLIGSDAFVDPGTYSVRYETGMGIDQDLNIHVTSYAYNTSAPWEPALARELRWDLPVRAVVADSASPGAASMVFVDAQAVQGMDSAFSQRAFIDVRDGASVARVTERIDAIGLEGDVHATDLDARRAELVETERLVIVGVWGLVGGMTIAAGLALIFVLMALLVEERRATLATLRASGATVSAIASMHLAEALVYGLLAVGPALLLGVLLAATLDLPLHEGVSTSLVVRPLAVWAGIGLSLGLVLIASAVAAFRAGRLHIPTALRGQEPPVAGASRARYLAVILFFLLGVAYLPSALAGGAVGLTLAPCWFVLGLMLLAGTWVPRHVAFPVAGALIATWLIITRSFTNDFESIAEVVLLPLRALMFCGALAVVAAYARPVHQGLGWLWRHTRYAVGIESGLAYLRGRPGRAALTVFVLGMVLLGVTFLGAVVPSEAEGWADMGGYDAYGAAEAYTDDLKAYLEANPAPDGQDPWEHVRRWQQVEWVSEAGTLWYDRGGSNSGPIMAVDQTFIRDTTFHTVAGPSLSTAMTVLEDNPGTIIVQAPTYDEEEVRNALGTVWSLGKENRPDERFELTIIAQVNENLGPGIWTSEDTLAMIEQFAGVERVTGLWIQVDDGYEPDLAAWEVERAMPGLGLRLQARPIDPLVPAVITMFSVFTLLTLTIGATALGLITSRNALSRQRQIGAMRAIGAQRPQVVAMVMTEAVYMVGLAALVGVSGAAISLAGLTDIVPYEIPWAWTLSLAGYVVLAAGVAAALPAWSAARKDPAAAARYVE